MFFDKFDICEAWYLALSDCHGGQWSDSYARLCHLTEFFRPSPLLSVDRLNENAIEIYRAAVEKLTGKPYELESEVIA